MVIYGPREPKSRSNSHPDKAVISVEVGVVPWAQSGGAKKSRGDRYVYSKLIWLWSSMAGLKLTSSRLQEVGASIRQTFEPVIMTHLYPRSEISIHVSVLSADGGESDI